MVMVIDVLLKIGMFKSLGSDQDKVEHYHPLMMVKLRSIKMASHRDFPLLITSKLLILMTMGEMMPLLLVLESQS